MANKAFVKCKYCDGYAHDFRYFENGRTVIGNKYRYVDHVVCGEFSNVSWDGQACRLVLKAPKKNICIEEFDYQYSGTEPQEEHVHRFIEYLAIDDFVVIDKREENTGEET